MSRRIPPELASLRRALRTQLQLRLDIAHHRNAHTSTSAIELRNEVDQMTQAGAIHCARAACERTGIRIPQDTARLSRRYTKATGGGYWAAIVNPTEVVWDPELERWV